MKGLQIEGSSGSGSIWKIDFFSKAPLAPGFEKEIERLVLGQIKGGERPEIAHLEKTGAVSRFKQMKQPFFSEMCRSNRGNIVPALKSGHFYMPLEKEGEGDMPASFTLLLEKESLFVLVGEKKILKEAIAKRKEHSHEMIGKELFECIDGYVGYKSKGAFLKGRTKQFLCRKMPFSPISFRGGGDQVWSFLEKLESGAYFQLEPVEKEERCGLVSGLFNLKCEGALAIRQIGSKEDLVATENSSLQLIDEILKIGDICDIFTREGSRGVAMSALLQEVPLCEWKNEGGHFELLFYIDRWIGVLIEHSKRAEWLMTEDSFEN